MCSQISPPSIGIIWSRRTIRMGTISSESNNQFFSPRSRHPSAHGHPSPGCCTTYRKRAEETAAAEDRYGVPVTHLVWSGGRQTTMSSSVIIGRQRGNKLPKDSSSGRPFTRDDRDRMLSAARQWKSRSSSACASWRASSPHRDLEERTEVKRLEHVLLDVVDGLRMVIRSLLS